MRTWGLQSFVMRFQPQCCLLDPITNCPSGDEAAADEFPQHIADQILGDAEVADVEHIYAHKFQAEARKGKEWAKRNAICPHLIE